MKIKVTGIYVDDQEKALRPSGSGSGGSYAYGSVVTLTATPSTGYQFSSWSGDISTSSPTVNVTMYSNKNVIANFSAIHYTLSTSVSPSGGGSISPQWQLRLRLCCHINSNSLPGINSHPERRYIYLKSNS